MATYIVGYDLNKSGQNYAKLIERLRQYPNWWHYLGSTWIIVTSDSAEKVRNDLQACIDANDELLVVLSGGVAAWYGFDENGSNWLHQNL